MKIHQFQPRFSWIFILLVIHNSQRITPILEPDFPCRPPQHSVYPFCNASISISDRAWALISNLTLDEKIGQLSNSALAIPRLGIPAFEWWSESLHGIADNGPGVTFHGIVTKATVFPQVILTASSFNRSLWRSIARAVAVEARAMYNVRQAGLTFWAPNINIFRDPRWGRGQETPGEDPLLTSSYSIEFVNGFQGDNSWDEHGEKESDDLMLSACCKHYTAYDLDKWGGFTTFDYNAVVTEQDMADTYEPPFRSCIQQGKASCLMCSYNSINGIPACAHKYLLQKARQEWDFKGYIVSDCDAVETIYAYHNFTKSPEDAVALSLKAGIDNNCGTYLLRYTKSAIYQGKLGEKDIDRALFNLISVQIRLGFYNGNPKKMEFGNLGPKDVCTTDHQKLALEAVKQGIVLLKNDKRLLPLEKNKISSLAIIGPMANSTKLGGTYTGIPCIEKSILDEFREHVEKIYYAAGCVDGVPCLSKAGIKDAISIAKEAEVVIVVAGLDLSQESEGLDRYSLLLPGHQTDLITSVASKAKKPIVLVLTGGGPLDVKFADMDPRVASIIWIGYPGEAGGKALAEVIFGSHNPGGRLPITWYPESFTSIPMTDMSMRANASRAYPGRTYRFYTGEQIYGFGHGLSYTNFTYNIVSAPGKLKLSRSTSRKITNYIYVDEVDNCDSLTFNVEVSVLNEGTLDGSYVVMLFSRVPSHFKDAPQKQLIWFDSVETIGHKVAEIIISVNACTSLNVVDNKGKKVLPLGDYTLLLGDKEYIISVVI